MLRAARETRTNATEREAIQAAIPRLLAGQPIASTGALTMLQLATEAGVERWVLTHELSTQGRVRTAQDRNQQHSHRLHALHTRAVDAEAANRKLAEENKWLREESRSTPK